MLWGRVGVRTGDQAGKERFAGEVFVVFFEVLFCRDYELYGGEFVPGNGALWLVDG